MAGKLRTLWQACGGEIAQLNIPAVFFHPPLDGRDFFIPSRGRHVAAKLRSLTSRLYNKSFSFIPPLDGRDFFIPPRGRHVAAKLRNLTFRLCNKPFSFILPLTGEIFLYRPAAGACSEEFTAFFVSSFPSSVFSCSPCFFSFFFFSLFSSFPFCSFPLFPLFRFFPCSSFFPLFCFPFPSFRSFFFRPSHLSRFALCVYKTLLPL